MAIEFKALLVEQPEKKVFTRSIVTRSLDDLPEGELVVKVHYSSLNFKDALSAVGNPGVTRNFPHTPGIDAAGEVISCDDDFLQPGEQAERRRAAFLEVVDLLSGRAQPVAVAERWLSESPEEIIGWLISWTADLIRLRSAPAWKTLGNPDFGESLQRLSERLDLESLFEHWSLLLQSGRALSGQSNRQLLLEEVLIRWSELGKNYDKTRSWP